MSKQELAEKFELLREEDQLFIAWLSLDLLKDRVEKELDQTGVDSKESIRHTFYLLDIKKALTALHTELFYDLF